VTTSLGRRFRRTVAALLCVLGVHCGGSSSSGGPGPTAPAPGPANIAGSWNLQTHASSSCVNNLALDSRNRSYLVTITQTGSAAEVVFVGSIPVMSVSVTSTQVTGAMAFIDQVPGSTMSFTGTFSGEISGTIISGTLDGAFQNLNTGAACVAANHVMVLTKQ
jgi:hypothetical protein